MLDTVNLKMIFQCMCQKSVGTVANIDQVKFDNSAKPYFVATDKSYFSPTSRILEKVLSFPNLVSDTIPFEQQIPEGAMIEPGISQQEIINNLSVVVSDSSD